MKVDLDDFVAATRKLHAGSVKRTRLMLKIRPQTRAERSGRIFILKSTDGKTVYTTHVTNLAELKKVEALVNDFVMNCTKDSIQPPPPPPQQSTSPTPAPATSPAASTAATAASAGSTGGSSANKGGGGKQQAPPQPSQQQQQQQGGGSRKSKKGKK